jgi:hypothetical protein
MTAGTLVIASIYLALHIYLGQGSTFLTLAAFFLVLLGVRVMHGRQSARAVVPATGSRSPE